MGEHFLDLLYKSFKLYFKNGVLRPLNKGIQTTAQHFLSRVLGSLNNCPEVQGLESTDFQTTAWCLKAQSSAQHF